MTELDIAQRDNQTETETVAEKVAAAAKKLDIVHGYLIEAFQNPLDIVLHKAQVNVSNDFGQNNTSKNHFYGSWDFKDSFAYSYLKQLFMYLFDYFKLHMPAAVQRKYPSLQCIYVHSIHS